MEENILQQHIVTRISHGKKNKKKKQRKFKIITKVCTNKSKSTDNNQHFFCPITQSSKTVINKTNRKTYPYKETMKIVCW